MHHTCLRVLAGRERAATSQGQDSLSAKVHVRSLSQGWAFVKAFPVRVVCPRAGADPRTLGPAIPRRDSIRAWLWRGHPLPQCALLEADSNEPSAPASRFAKSQTPQDGVWK